MIPCVEVLAEDFDDRWRDGESVLVYREVERRWPQGFQQKEVVATTLDPRKRWVYLIGAHEHDKV